MASWQARSLEIVDLQTKLENYTNQVVKAELKCQKAVEERDAATRISASLEGVQERLIAANKALAAIHFEQEGLKQKLVQKELELAEAGKQIEVLQAAQQTLSNSLQKQVELTADVIKERDDLAERLRVLEAQLKTNDANVADLHLELAKRETAIASKEANLQKLNAQLDRAQDMIHNQSIELLDKQDMVSELERSQHNLQRILDSQVCPAHDTLSEQTEEARTSPCISPDSCSSGCWGTPRHSICCCAYCIPLKSCKMGCLMWRLAEASCFEQVAAGHQLTISICHMLPGQPPKQAIINEDPPRDSVLPLDEVYHTPAALLSPIVWSCSQSNWSRRRRLLHPRPQTPQRQ